MKMEENRDASDRVCVPINGVNFTFKKKIRCTQIAKFKQTNKKTVSLLSSFLEGIDASNMLALQANITKATVESFDLDEIMGAITFLAKTLYNVEGAASNSGAPVEWGNLEEKDKIDFLDYNLQPFNIFILFMLAWMQYSGLK